MNNSLYLGVFLLFAGIVLVVVGFLEKGLSAAASKEPEEIALKDLITRGPEGNPNILLKDFDLCENYVYRTKNGLWEAAWVPAVPSDVMGAGRGGKPTIVQALIFTINARDPSGLYQLCGQARLRALVTNKITSLGSEERALLEQSYPGTDFSRCLIIQEGREPAGPMKLVFMVGGGSLLALAGLGLLVFDFLPQKAEQAGHRRRKQEMEVDEQEDGPRPRLRRRL
jgi:hypothetical protein